VYYLHISSQCVQFIKVTNTCKKSKEISVKGDSDIEQEGKEN
jgi:hypothetical protein